MNPAIRKKLIEVSIPLEAINVASAREKSIRHGHPSTLHLWWARRPLAACRAILFAQIVDDPSSWPDRFTTTEAQDVERRRLHRVIEDMVPWEASNNETILNAARWEIARSLAWGFGEEPPSPDDGDAILEYLQRNAPPIYDPFSGGGSIPLEAQRLGLRAYGSDLNPVAVLIGKALIEIPPKFAGLRPVNSSARADAKHGELRDWRGAQGLAEDVRYYGQWMRDEAERRIGHFYPKAKLPDGSEATVIAWVWARTVRSPDPAAKGASVPLVSSFILSAKEGSKAWAEPIIDPDAPEGWRVEVRTGTPSKADEERLKKGTKGEGRGSEFSCLLTGAPITGDYIKSEGMAGRLGDRLIGIIAGGNRKRSYHSPDTEHEKPIHDLAKDPRVEEEREGPLNQPLPAKLTGGTCFGYGLTTFGKLFTPRQIIGLTTFSDLVLEAKEKARLDALAAGRDPDEAALHAGGSGATAYADAVATYLAFAVDKVCEGSNSICTWSPLPTKLHVVSAFGRQALPMVWDYAEANPFGTSSGNMQRMADLVAKVIDFNCSVPTLPGVETQHDAAKNNFPQNIVISTDPPYYDNIAYADLSDFFYVWLRRSLLNIWPDLFRRLAVPKSEELVATAYRHGGRDAAEAFFMKGMSEALNAMKKSAAHGEPLAIYYAFKQSEAGRDGVTSAGWASFLQAVVDAGLGIDGTWPVRTERAGGFRNMDANALASSIVLVCRSRLTTAPTTTRADFVRALKRGLPNAIEDIRKAGVGPVDMQQSVIGPGMGIFSRYDKILEDDDSAMPVKTALSLINRVWGEIENELDANFDPQTQVALAWYSDYQFDARPSGDLIMLANAKNISSDGLFASDVFTNLRGKAALTARNDLPEGWRPSADKTLTVWECVQHTARVLNAEDGGGAAAGRLVAEMGSKAAEARALAYRLFEIATQKGWAAEALIYNELAQEWPKLEDLASTAEVRASTAAAQAELF
jgi:putative DNA methylase